MKIIKPSYEILTNISDGGINELRKIEKIARLCYKSTHGITDNIENTKRFVSMLLKNKHEAMLEHESISVLFIVDRGVTHELVRHRLASFAQESTRFCNYSQDKFGNEITVIEPCFFGIGSDVNGLDTNRMYESWKNACEVAEKEYLNLLKIGATTQQARTVLPTSTKAEIVVTANYREWRHILNLRAAGTTGRPHPQMLEIMIPLLKELQSKIPVIFDDIEDKYIK